MSISIDTRFLIVGLGLIGGSYAEGLTEKGYYVGALARREETISCALERGIIREGAIDVREDFVSKYDVIVFCLYPGQFVEWVEKHQDKIKSGALLTDVTGVKGQLVDKIQSMLRSDLEFVAAHPMAGRERSGLENASCSIFKDANYIVTPTGANTPEAIDDVMEIGRILGFRKVSRLSVEEHDEIIGFLSQLTHCIAIALMTCKDGERLADLTGDSFRDLTRIAKINDRMWSELFMLNKKELLAQMDLFLARFLKLRTALENDDAGAMREMMRESTEKRLRFDAR